MSAGQSAGKHEADRLAEQARDTIEVVRHIREVEETLRSIGCLGDHLHLNVRRHAVGAKPHQRAAAETAYALEDAIRALAERGQHEVEWLAREYAASLGVEDLSGIPESNAYWIGPGDGPDS